MKKMAFVVMGLVASLASASAFAADTAHVLHCGTSSSKEDATNEILTHFAVPGYEVGQVIVDSSDYTLKASYLGGELDLELTEKATGIKVTSESYGGIPAGKMPKVMTFKDGSFVAIGYCTLK